MLKGLKKMLILIPCMIFSFFLVSSMEVEAAKQREPRVSLNGAQKIEIGEEIYYFTTSTSWEFSVKSGGVYGVVYEDRFLKYTVTKPDGKTTKQSGRQTYLNTGYKFSINDINSLGYSENDTNVRNSILPENTYYVDIQYYTDAILWIPNELEDMRETVKIVVGNTVDDSANNPVVGVEYNATTNKYKIRASASASVITEVKYYFSQTAVADLNKNNFAEKMELSTYSGSPSVALANRIETDIDGVDSSYKYLYVLVKTGHGYSELATFEILNSGSGNMNSTDTDNDKDEAPVSSDADSKGLFDFQFGEIILLVLVVVLIVSCVLILTQKIVDYKKRLY